MPAAPWCRCLIAQAQRGDHGAGDLFLNGERVLHAAVELVRPKLVPLAGDQPRADPQVVADFPHAALEQRGDAERARHLADVGGLALEVEGRAAGRDAQAGDGRQRVEDLLGDAVAHPVLVLGRAQVGEGEHGDAGRAARRGRDAMRAPEIPGHAGGSQHDARDDQRDQQPAARRSGAFDPSSLDVEGPGQHQREGKTETERNHRRRHRLSARAYCRSSLLLIKNRKSQIANRKFGLESSPLPPASLRSSSTWAYSFCTMQALKP